ncbi:MAG: hypothetical protein BWZ10_02884 [candidate division BRC1 bacterium ADurb.BinA364]|nr:MAG: hypothetical protein BWZ10_02884 [candidate division BRC1 bacterium ADurb.BinA364]
MEIDFGRHAALGQSLRHRLEQSGGDGDFFLPENAKRMRQRDELAFEKAVEYSQIAVGGEFGFRRRLGAAESEAVHRAEGEAGAAAILGADHGQAHRIGVDFEADLARGASFGGGHREVGFGAAVVLRGAENAVVPVGAAPVFVRGKIEMAAVFGKPHVGQAKRLRQIERFANIHILGAVGERRMHMPIDEPQRFGHGQGMRVGRDRIAIDLDDPEPKGAFAQRRDGGEDHAAGAKRFEPFVVMPRQREREAGLSHGLDRFLGVLVIVGALGRAGRKQGRVLAGGEARPLVARQRRDALLRLRRTAGVESRLFRIDEAGQMQFA